MISGTLGEIGDRMKRKVKEDGCKKLSKARRAKACHSKPLLRRTGGNVVPRLVAQSPCCGVIEARSARMC